MSPADRKFYSFRYTLRTGRKSHDFRYVHSSAEGLPNRFLRAAAAVCAALRDVAADHAMAGRATASCARLAGHILQVRKGAALDDVGQRRFADLQAAAHNRVLFEKYDHGRKGF
jgi:RecB family exonuclease